uniref:Deoxyribose-phosphate aldolase n=1 Tax=Candidatus Kentrum sp. LPFa TaxID=2126335 RepID=A0A450VUQ5_9GAMM|nr:MAG: deoxyribose-phosphate aldolase [Candidatus Kentron sp. LPFa]VFK25192.1 MAG: deoxyribose-phosphate aldolase [Candidatus Kentron sp. LPFa]
MKNNEIANRADYTLLKPETTHQDLDILCGEAIEYGFACVCVNPSNVHYVADALRDSEVGVCSVAGFPFGASKTNVKAYEARMAIEDGAREIDMVIDIGELKNGNYQLVELDIRLVKEIVGKDIILKVIIEAPLLTGQEKILATEFVVSAGADYVKTATGINAGGATREDVALLKRVANGRIKVKAAGGIRDHATAIAMIESGADRIGTSAGPRILGI